MIHSARRIGKAKAMAEVLAMIADVHPEPSPHRPRPARAADECFWEDAAEFMAALEKYCAGHPQRRAGRVAQTRRSGVHAA